MAIFWSMDLGLTVASSNEADGRWNRLGVASVFVLLAAYYSSIGPISYIYSAEVLPLPLRAKGSSIASAANCKQSNIYLTARSLTVLIDIGIAIICQLTPLAYDKIHWRYDFVFIGINLSISALALFLLKETKGLALEQIAALFGEPIKPSSDYQRNETGGRPNAPNSIK